MSRPFQMTSPVCDLVGRVAHQRVGEGRLARPVAAHDRVDLALANGEVDAAQDLALAVRDRHHVQVADDQLAIVVCLAGRGVGWSVECLGHESLVGARWEVAISSSIGSGAEWYGCVGRGVARSASVIESSAVVIALRTVDPQVVDVAEARCVRRCRRGLGSSLAQTMGAMGPSSARSTSPMRISRRLSRQLVAAVRAARAGHEPGFAQAHHELLEVRARQDFVVGHLGKADGAGAVVPRELDHHAHAVLAARAEMHGAGTGEDAARPLGRCRGGRRRRLRHGRRRGLRIPSDHVRIESSRGPIYPQSPPKGRRCSSTREPPALFSPWEVTANLTR